MDSWTALRRRVWNNIRLCIRRRCLEPDLISIMNSIWEKTGGPVPMHVENQIKEDLRND